MYKPTTITVVVLVLGFAFVAMPAQAHHVMDGMLPQTFLQGLLSGLGHPLIGLDHAAFILCAGFFLALVERGMAGVVALIAGSLVGAAMFQAGLRLPAGEVLVALSVILIGGLLLARRAIKLAWLLVAFALAGVFHGYAYGESIFGAEPAPLGAYLLGLSLIQFAVAVAAFCVHRRLIAMREAMAKSASTAIGAVTAIIGTAYLLVGALSA